CPTGWYPPSYVGPLDRWHFDGVTHLSASLVMFEHDQRSGPAPQAHRGNRARDRTCVVCYSAYLGGGQCTNEPRYPTTPENCPRSRRISDALRKMNGNAAFLNNKSCRGLKATSLHLTRPSPMYH
ncbi:hypothetical protein N9L68_05835, partial [bacterium]|nr:hypothetical protein [bacterium]